MMKTFAHYFDGPTLGGYEDALPIIPMEEKLPDRRRGLGKGKCCHVQIESLP
jgi:hypothetical protein